MIIVKKIKNLLINIQEDSIIISNNALFIPYIVLALQNLLFSVFLKGDIAKGVKELTTPYKELHDTNPPLVTIMLGDMQLSDIERFAQILSQNTVVNHHIWLISEQFLLAYIDLYGTFPQYMNQKFICYHSPSKLHSGHRQTGCTGCSLAQNVSLALDLRLFISLGVDEIVNVGSGPPQGLSDNVELLYLDSVQRTLVKLAWTKQSLGLLSET